MLVLSGIELGEPYLSLTYFTLTRECFLPYLDELSG
jgi:hypothetical protein